MPILDHRMSVDRLWMPGCNPSPVFSADKRNPLSLSVTLPREGICVGAQLTSGVGYKLSVSSTAERVGKSAHPH